MNKREKFMLYVVYFGTVFLLGVYITKTFLDLNR